jgi:hypothetical protein
VKRTLAISAAALALSSCFIHERQPQPRAVTGAWAEQRDLATRGAKLYDGIEHRASAAVVHLSLPVREARARRLAEWLGWTPVELERALARERAEAAAGEEFLLSFYTADRFANELDTEGTIWRVALVVDGVDLLPTAIEGLEADATTRELFPMIGPFDQLYRLRFPRAAGGELDGRAFVLRIASGLGKLDVDYEEAPGLPVGMEVVPPPQRR